MQRLHLLCILRCTMDSLRGDIIIPSDKPEVTLRITFSTSSAVRTNRPQIFLRHEIVWYYTYIGVLR